MKAIPVSNALYRRARRATRAASREGEAPPGLDLVFERAVLRALEVADRIERTPTVPIPRSALPIAHERTPVQQVAAAAAIARGRRARLPDTDSPPIGALADTFERGHRRDEVAEDVAPDDPELARIIAADDELHRIKGH